MHDRIERPDMNPLDWLNGLAQAIAGWYTEGVKQSINFLLMYSVPSPDEIKGKFFSTALGGTFGLSTLLIGGVAIFVGAAVIVRFNRDHGRKISKMISSIVWLVVFVLLFYRGYSLLYGFFQGVGQGALNLLTSTAGGTVAQLNNILLVVTPQGVGAILILGTFSAVFSLFTLAEAFAFHVILYGLLIVYPLLIALRPLPVFNTLFHAANSAVVVVALSPSVMVWAYALPVIISNGFPGATASGLSVVLTFVCSLFAFAVPIVLAVLVFNTSRQVFGKVESQVEGAVSIISMPPVDMNDVRRDIDQVHASPMKAILTEVVGDGLLHGDLFDDFGKVAVNAAATGFAVAGHPYVSAGIKAVPTFITTVKEKMSPTTPEPPEGGGVDT